MLHTFNGRWTMDVFGIRKDPVSVKLNQALPNTSIPGLWLCLFPLYLRYKITGTNRFYPSIPEREQEGPADIMIAKTLYFDEIIRKYHDTVEQFVVMGAGFDTRCYGELADSSLKLFELDLATIQQLKKKCLAKAGVNTDNVQFVQVDFETDRWYENLAQAGFDTTKKTLFLWEGVTLYLSESDVRQTLQEIRDNTATGSTVVADLYARRFVTGEYMPGMKAALPTLKITDEELSFGLDFSSDCEGALNAFLQSENTRAGDTYFMGTRSKRGTYMVVAEICL